MSCLLVCSNAFVPKNINLGNNDTKRATGPTMAAIFAFEKNVAIRKQNGISDKLKRKKYIKTRNRLDRGRKELLHKNADDTDTQKNRANAVIDQARLLTQGLSPMISITSFILLSFSSTIDFTSLDTGYNVDTSRNNTRNHMNKLVYDKFYWENNNNCSILVSASPRRNPTWV